MNLTCPKCQGEMRQYERNAVLVDQCTQCRGIFLDRGELDKLIDAEARWADAASPAAAPGYQPAPPQPQYEQPGYGQPGYYQPYREHYYQKNKRRSFLDELFG